MADHDARNQPVRAIVWMVGSLACFVVTATIVRGLAERIHPVELAFLRVALALVILSPAFWRYGIGVLATQHLGTHALRAATNYGAIVCAFVALGAMPVAEVAALQFTLPIVTMLLSLAFLKERIPPGGWVACLTGLLGAAIILRPGFEVVKLVSLLPLMSVFGYAGANVALRFLTGHDKPITLMLLSTVLMLPLSLVPALFFWSWPDPADYGWVALMALANTAAQYGLTRAFSYAGARVVMPLDFLRLPMAAALGLVVFGEFPNVWTWLGAAIIFFSGYRLLQRERRAVGG